MQSSTGEKIYKEQQKCPKLRVKILYKDPDTFWGCNKVTLVF